MCENRSAARFPTTNWSRVVAAGDRAGPEHGEALAELCHAYWYPLYAFIRRRGYEPADAQDLTQSYFARLADRGVLAAADRKKGRFRAFLRTDCGFFLADQRDRERALKRGGGVVVVSIDARDAEGRYRVEPAEATTPDRLFDRAWALTLLGRVLDLLEREYTDAGRSAFFERLKIVLTDGPRAIAYAAIADELGMTESAVEGAVRRLRNRYRDLLRDEIAATLGDPSPEAIAAEIRDLFAALRR
jgi:RNA polymerase sigma-70 factor (ECF subfamily)